MHLALRRLLEETVVFPKQALSYEQSDGFGNWGYDGGELRWTLKAARS